MSFLSKLFGPKQDSPTLDYGFDIVGESHYQDVLEKLAGGRTEEGVAVEYDARLVPERKNPYDPNAVRVDIKGQTVGYLSREDAKLYRKAAGTKENVAPTLIVGGWDRGKKDRGHFGVKLALEFKYR
jgi:hypothetical protein